MESLFAVLGLFFAIYGSIVLAATLIGALSGTILGVSFMGQRADNGFGGTMFGGFAGLLVGLFPGFGLSLVATVITLIAKIAGL
jgi:hypothetical protein